MTEQSLAKRIKDAYLKFHKSIIPETSEHDVRSRFIQYFIREGLGYPDKCYINEKKWADIWLLDKEARRSPKGEKEQFRLQVLPVVVIETKSKILDLEICLSSIDKIIEGSEAPTCTAGLSRLLGKREAIETRIQQVVRRKRIISFSKDGRALLECTSEDAALFIERVFQERLQQIENKTLGYVLSETKLPDNDEALRIVLRFEEKLKRDHVRLVRVLDKLKDQLNTKVAELYRLDKTEYAILKKALATISGKASNAKSTAYSKKNV